MGEGGFKAHDARLGPKLGQSLASGPTGLERRIAAARDREREAVEARRAAARAFNGMPSEAVIEAGGVLLMQDRHLEAIKAAEAARAGGEQGTKGPAAEVKPKGGRPRKHEGEPWKAAGVSRAQWYRARKREEAP
jgi:hypothetical protein